MALQHAQQAQCDGTSAHTGRGAPYSPRIMQCTPETPPGLSHKADPETTYSSGPGGSTQQTSHLVMQGHPRTHGASCSLRICCSGSRAPSSQRGGHTETLRGWQWCCERVPQGHRGSLHTLHARPRQAPDTLSRPGSRDRKPHARNSRASLGCHCVTVQEAAKAGTLPGLTGKEDTLSCGNEKRCPEEEGNGKEEKKRQVND